MDLVYAARLPATSLSQSTTLPVLVLQAAATKPLEILRLKITQSSSTTSATAEYEIINSTTNGPGTPATGNAVVAKNDPSNPAQGFIVFGSGFSGAPTGTQNILERQAYNVLNGELYLPVPEERFEIPAAGFLWIRLPLLPASTTVNITCVVLEKG